MLQLTLVAYNVDSAGERDYLSAGERTLPSWFLAIFAVLCIQLVVWVRYVWAHREHAKHIHHLMTVVLVLKMITVMLEGVSFSCVFSVSLSPFA